jgi:hypothetical protein
VFSAGGTKGFTQKPTFVRLFAPVSLDWSLAHGYTFLDEDLKQSQRVTLARSNRLQTWSPLK